MISQKLDPNRLPKEVNSLKAEKTLHRVTFNPSSAKPGETLYVNLPSLSEDVVLVPNTLALRFDLTIQPTTTDERVVVQNVGRNIISRLKVTMAGEILQDLNRYDLYKTYEDLYKDRDALIAQGISSLLVRKFRTPTKTAPSDSGGAKAAASAYGKKYLAPLDFDLITKHGAFYPRGNSSITFEVTLSEANNLIGSLTTALTGEQTYSMTNIELQYESIQSSALAPRASRAFVYDHVHLYKTFTFKDKADTKINEAVNLPRRSMVGIFMLFVKPFGSGQRDSESFYNSELSDVKVTITGVPNKVYSAGMTAGDLYETAQRRFSGDRTIVTPEQFYTDKYCLWVDLRTHEDNNAHGSGLRLINAQDGVSLEITRSAHTTETTINGYIFVVSDAQVNVSNGSVVSVMY